MPEHHFDGHRGAGATKRVAMACLFDPVNFGAIALPNRIMMGRLVHPDLGGGQPVSSSATTAPDYARTYEGKKSYVQARAATHDDIARIVGDYAHAARNAIRAGFDGVQVHGANGYLVDQFLRDGANFRTDEYGGSIANRLRFMTEVLEAVGGAIGIDRVGIRFSPNLESQGVEDSNPLPL